MRFLRRLATVVRFAWQTVGAVLLLLLIINALLLWLLPDPLQSKQRVPGSKAPSKQSSDAYEGYRWVADYYNEHRSARSMQWEPFTYWRRQQFSGQQITIDENGIRQSWSRPDASREVWMFGGSAVWGTGVDNNHTLPSLLGRQYDENGQAYRFVNFGESGYVSSQGLIRLVRRLQAGHRPYAVIFYDGANDVFSALQSGQAGIAQNEQQRALDFAMGRGEPAAYLLSAFEGIARLVAPPSGDLDIPVLAQSVVSAYKTNVEAVEALASVYGFRTFFFWQPTLFSRDQPSQFEARVLDAAWSDHRQLQLLSDQLVAEVLTEKANFFALTDALDDGIETRYLDFVHLGPRGNTEVATQMRMHLGDL